MKSTTQTAADTPSVIRPYTSYNLFFQLEREYLLQTKLGHKPNIKKLFNPKDKSNYQGPPLPPRYASLILPYDWHIPGKEKRRKRSHRKSHGILGFHEMNRQVSSNWKTIDSTTRKFCKSLADMEAVKFKKNKKNTPTMKRKYKKVKSNKNTLGKSILATITHEQQVTQWIQSAKKNNQPSNDNDMLVDDVWDNVCASVDVDFLNDDFFGFTSNSSSDDIMSQVTSSTTSGSSSCSNDSIISTVDISDDDIITLWKDTSVQEETAVDKVRVVSSTKQQDQKKRMSLLTTPKRKTMAACKA